MNIVATTLMHKDGRGVHSDMLNLVAGTLRASDGGIGSPEHCGELVAHHTLTTEPYAGEDGSGRGTPIVADVYQCHGSNVGPFGTLRKGNGHESGGVPFVASTRSGVRRLLPIECERLQGFPDRWTELDADGKPISNSARYRMLGNAVAVPVAHWIGQRLMEANRAN